MQRFYLPTPEIKDGLVIINDNRIVYQARKVLRMWKGDKFHIFNDDEKLVEIIEINKNRIIANVIEAIKNNTESELKLSLYQAIPKKPALFELIVQKAVEIGVSEIYPLITKRTEKRRMAKFERLSSIAMEATEQSGRLKIPIIRHPVNFEDIIENLSNSYLAYEYEKNKYLLDYKNNLYKRKECQIIIGPEGGFSHHEINIANKAKVKMFTLGPRILRMETAAISSLSLVLLNKKI